jgi:hypothetical protein
MRASPTANRRPPSSALHDKCQSPPVNLALEHPGPYLHTGLDVACIRPRPPIAFEMQSFVFARRRSADRAPLITVDLRLIEASGIGTYLQNIVPRVVSSMSWARFCFIGQPEKLGRFEWTGADRVRVNPCGAPPYSPYEQAALHRAIPSTTALYWAPHINLPLLFQGPMVLTLHDAFYARAREVPVRWDKRAYAKLLLHAATRKPQARCSH